MKKENHIIYEFKNISVLYMYVHHLISMEKYNRLQTIYTTTRPNITAKYKQITVTIDWIQVMGIKGHQ